MEGGVVGGALLDAELLSDVYLELRGGRQSALILQAEAANSGNVEDLRFADANALPARSFPPSDEERAAHKALIAKLDDPIWLKIV